MKSRILSAVMGIAILLSLAACAVQSPVGSNNSPINRTLNANGVGEVAITPDVAYIFVGVRSQAENVENALDQNNKQSAAVSSALQELGVDPLDIQTSAFNIYPQQFYGPMGPTSPEDMGTTMYVVENTVYITVRDLQKLGGVLNAVVRAGANNINGINFDVSDKSEAIAQARKLAIDAAKSKAQAIAADAGIQLGDLITLNVYENQNVVPLYEGKYVGGAGAGVPVSAGQMKVQVTADLIYEIK